MSKYVFEVTSKLLFVKKLTTSSLTLFMYGVTTDILLIFFFFKAFKAAVLGAVTEALGFARLIFFFILSYSDTIVP